MSAPRRTWTESDSTRPLALFLGMFMAGLLSVAPLAAQMSVDSAAQNGYYRQPTLRGGRVVFVAEGDLWSVAVTGGTAERLTTHPEDESDPALSPDGRWLAFTATYEGPREVYVMPAEGGLPRRLTYEGGARVTGWTVDGRILYTTTRYSTLPQQNLLALDPETGAREEIPLADADDGAWDGTGETFYFTRFAHQSSNTKRYRGGTAQNVWKWVRGAAEAQPLTGDFDGTSRTPMPWNGRIYFVSDRDNDINIWSMDANGGDLRQHTHHVGWDVLGPAQDGGRIVYQLGADLRLYDIASGTDRLIPIRLVSDFDQSRERWIADPSRYLDDWSLAPSGDRLGLVARGRAFVAPTGRGRLVQAARTHGVRYRNVLFRPGTDELLVLSDESGEVEWWRVPANGIGERHQVTKGGDNLRMGGAVSPDGERLVHWDHANRLWLTDIESGSTSRIDFAAQGGWGFEAPVWSRDSRWFVYGKPADNLLMQLWLYDTKTGTSTPVTTDRYDSYAPTWSPDGKWIWFLSDRNFRSLVTEPWGSREPEPYFTDQTVAMGVALVPDAPDPWAEPTELVAKDTSSTRTAATTAPVEIVLDGIQERLVRLPLKPGNYGGLEAAGKNIYWTSRATRDDSADLMAVTIGPDPKPVTVADSVTSWHLSTDGKKLSFRSGNAFHVVDAAATKSTLSGDSRVDLSGWSFAVEPREDWHQLFVDSWRLERDYYYDPAMHGVDWAKMRAKYEPLVDRVRSRADLADLQAQMAGELATLHTFVYGGDFRQDPDSVNLGFLGARLMRDGGARGWRVSHIYRSDPDIPDELSPLARHGVDVSDGDLILTVNGQPTDQVPDINALLRNQAGKQVRLHVRSGEKERDVVVEPIDARRDADLRYDEWEYTRRMATDAASAGDIGYVHLRAMSTENIEEWYREYYPAFNRKGLIVDVRHNRGGNIESWILEKLMRKAWMYWQPREGDPYWNMQFAFRGPIVVLVDEHTASDGEAFAEGFKRLGLGKVIGTRTWGGEIWLSSSNRLVDRGIVTAAEDGVYGPDGKWLVENVGVIPDSVVDNPPHRSFGGDDPQLDAAIAYLKGRIAAGDWTPVPAHPPYPDKSVPENRRGGGNGRGGAGGS